MNRYAAAVSSHPVPVEAVGEVAGEILERLDGERPDLVVWFATPHFAGAFEDCAGGLDKLLEPVAMIGSTAGAVVGGARAAEGRPALAALGARFVPSARLAGLALEATAKGGTVTIGGWPDGVPARGTLLLMAEPRTFPAADFLQLVNGSVPDLQVVGGLTSAAAPLGPFGDRLALGDRVLPGGAVGVLLSEEVALAAAVSQGCRAVGRPLIVTGARAGLITELAGRPPAQRLAELAAEVGDDDRELLRRGLQLGIVVDEHRAEFDRGDFLVRDLLGLDAESGGLRPGEPVEVGQTVQFHVRDPAAADDDLRRTLADVAWNAGGAVLLFTGSGRRPPDVPDDAACVQETLGPVPLAGAFCAGEIGPIGGRNFLHDRSASLAVFRP